MAIQKFTNRVLSVIDRIYSIVGPISRVDAIDVSPPVLVHDVSREAELAGGVYGTAGVNFVTAGAGADTYASKTRAAFLAESQVAVPLAERGLDPSEVDVWVMGCHVLLEEADVGNLGEVQLGVNLGAIGGSNWLNGIFNTIDSAMPLTAASTRVYMHWASGAPTSQWFDRLPYPFLLPDQPASAFLVAVKDDAGGILTGVGVWRCWVGPAGCLPPLA